MKPIPRKLLIHTVTHGYSLTKTTWGVESGSSRTISRVRIEPSDKIIKSKDNTEQQLNAVLFYDCLNSSPNGVTFARDDTITFGGEVYRVEQVTPLYDESTLHHYELGLV